MKKLLLVAGLAVVALQAAAPREEPVGLVLGAGGGKVLRASTETALAVRAGDILFAGDSLQAGATPTSFLFCPTKTSQILEQGEILLDSKALKGKGKLGVSKPVNACFLPQLVRVQSQAFSC